jgi:hypothetical protein
MKYQRLILWCIGKHKLRKEKFIFIYSYKGREDPNDRPVQFEFKRCLLARQAAASKIGLQCN